MGRNTRGYASLLVAEHLGYKKGQASLDTYANLYPSKQNEVAAQLNELHSVVSKKRIPESVGYATLFGII